MSTQENQRSKIKIEREKKHLAEMQAHKSRMMPLIRFLKKRGLKFKHANVNSIRVQYFRLDTFHVLIEKHQKQIRENTQLLSLVNNLEEDIIYFRRPKESEKLKYPQILEPTSDVKRAKFAAFKFDTTQSKRLLVIGLIVAIILSVMFPIWPYELKYTAWLLSFSFLMFLLAVVVLRLIVYVTLAIFGLSFWIFPNLFGDQGIIDSFKPFYSVEKWDNNLGSSIGRIMAFALLIYYGCSIYKDPELYLENIESTKKAMEDFHDWGVGKIKGETGNFSQRALTVENILNQTADAYENITIIPEVSL